MTIEPKHRRIFLLLLCLAAAAIEGYDIQAFGVTARAIAVEFTLSSQELGWLASAAMLGLVIGAFAGGHLADRWGRRWVLAGSILVFGVCSLATALAPTEPLLFAARFAAGLGFGGTTPTLIAIAADIAPAKRRTLTVTTIFCGLPAGAALVAQVVRVMGDSIPWRSVYVLGGIAPLLLIPLVIWLVPGLPAVQTERSPRTSLRLLFAGQRGGSTLLIWFVFATTLLLAYVMLNWLPILVTAKGFGSTSGATAAMAFNLASIAGAFVLASLVDRIGFRAPLTAAYALLAVAIALMALCEQLSWMLALSSAAGFLIVGPQCALYALVTSIYPSSVRVLGAGAAVGMGRFGSILGPVIAGNLRESGFTSDEVFLTIAPLALIAAVSTLVLGKLVARSGAMSGADRSAVAL